MSIKDKYRVQSIKTEECKEWFLKKHYAKRIPPITFAFGLFRDKILQGVISFAPPCRMMNNGYCLFGGDYEVKTYELNRLVINEGLEKNVLSYFVSKSLDCLPKPCCVVSYADSNNGHHGYIYQATNWIFTGITNKRRKYFDKNGKEIHERTMVSKFGSSSFDEAIKNGIEITEQDGKYRYFQFLGNKRDKKNMLNRLVYDIEPYPKGENKRYDASYKPQVQGLLF